MSPARYAQHFLINKEAAQKIVASLSDARETPILEIGPGKGALTQPLVEKFQHVVAIEIDQTLISHLNRNISSGHLTVVHSDVLKVNLDALPFSEDQKGQIRVVGNLPYHLTSPILRRLAGWRSWERGCVMVQKEVGDRLCARLGTGEYGAITVGMNLTCEMEPLFELPPSSFKPPPQVTSMVVQLKRRKQPLTNDIPAVTRVIQAAFQQRRKTILNSLSHGLGLDKSRARDLLMDLSISPTLRAQDISVDQFVQLADTVSRLEKRMSGR